jgi:general secretion pathway protein C
MSRAFITSAACLYTPFVVLYGPAVEKASARQETVESKAGPELVTGRLPELVLEGVIVTADPSAAVALLRQPGSSRARAVKVGEKAYGFRLVEVSEGAIVLGRDGQLTRVTLAGEWTPTSETPTATTMTADVGSTPELEIDSVVKRELRRSLVEDRLIGELPVIVREARLVPRLTGGEITGFRITSLPEGTLLTEAGLKSGDVLLNINGIALNSAANFSELYPRLHAEDEVRVVVERHGEILKIVYSFN